MEPNDGEIPEETNFDDTYEIPLSTEDPIQIIDLQEVFPDDDIPALLGPPSDGNLDPLPVESFVEHTAPVSQEPEDQLYNRYLTGELSINDLMKKLYSSSKAQKPSKSIRPSNRSRPSNSLKNRRPPPTDMDESPDELDSQCLSSICDALVLERNLYTMKCEKK
ncbi:hypothetical protein ACTXT7_011236 [Hymenolepis weldensis]